MVKSKIYLNYNGETKSLSDWSRDIGVDYKTLHRRYKLGWSEEEILKTEIVFHGYARHELYRAWYSMKDRCNNIKSKDYKRYGGRGIKVCDSWLESPKNYIEDIEKVLGKKPTKNHTLDRINNDGNYEISNVQWADKSEQVVNTRERYNETGYRNISKNSCGKYVAMIRRGTHRAYSMPTYNLERAIELRDHYIKLYENNKNEWEFICKNKKYKRK